LKVRTNKKKCEKGTAKEGSPIRRASGLGVVLCRLKIRNNSLSGSDVKRGMTEDHSRAEKNTVSKEEAGEEGGNENERRRDNDKLS